MEMCKEDLLCLLLRDGAMNRTCARGSMNQLLDALAYLQNKGIAHRDVKLENLLVAASEQRPPNLKLCDFGLARQCGRLLGCATYIGSADYLAPEVRIRDVGREDGFACDIWSCGVVAYVLLIVESPYAEEEDLSSRTQGCLVPDVRLHAGGHPTPASFIQACMSVLPSERKEPVELAQMLWQAAESPIDAGHHKAS